MSFVLTQTPVALSLLHSARGFSSYGLLQKTLLQKIQSSSNEDHTATLTFLESCKFYHEWLSTSPQKLINEYEEAILSRVSLPEGVSSTRERVAGLHTLHFTNNTSPHVSNTKQEHHHHHQQQSLVETPTVLVHGHASSGIFYHRNFHALSKGIKSLYTVDLPDVGLSKEFPQLFYDGGRKVKKPRYDFKIDSKTGEYKMRQNPENRAIVEAVKEYYVNALENWRISKGLKKINLLGHSFGGYLSFFYSLKYPERVDKLILVSPAGVERSVFSLNTPEAGEVGDSLTKGVVETNDVTSNKYYRARFIPSAISTFGFGLTKMWGPLGVQLIAKYLTLRYGRGVVLYNSKAREKKEYEDRQDAVEKVTDMSVEVVNEQAVKDAELLKIFVKYTILLFYQNQKSYFLLQCLLNNQILAFDPIFDHVGKVHDGSSIKNDLLLLYGQYDWMNSKAGYELSQKHKEITDTSIFRIIEDAGHNIFLDNPDAFNNNVLRFLRS